MRINITDSVLEWVKCSRAVWDQWLKDRIHAADRFTPIENVLFNTLVIDEAGLPRSDANPFESIHVRYKSAPTGLRQVCRRQKAGNIFCRPESVEIDSHAYHAIRSIDPLGTMMDGLPYTEVLYHDAYILELVPELVYYAAIPESPPSAPRG